MCLANFSPRLLAATACAAALLCFAQPPACAQHAMKPNLKWTTAVSYGAEIGEPGVLLESEHVWLFAPARKATAARAIFGYLVKAYDELYRIVGAHTTYRIVVYHLPKGFGGTSECTIEYDYTNLDLDRAEEWRRHGVPHVSGYIEEMAHNFVSSCKAQFGWEMVGWSLGVVATSRVAPNPIFARQIEETRQRQAETFARYVSGGFVFPADIEPNLCDRIHAHLLRLCEQRYGPRFWPDVFREIRAARRSLDDAVNLRGDDNIRNERYRITVECFDRLPGLGFRAMLTRYGISPTVDVKSLHPTEPGWDRRFVPRKPDGTPPGA